MHTTTMKLVGSQVCDLLVVLYIHNIYLAVEHIASHKSLNGRCDAGEWYMIHMKNSPSVHRCRGQKVAQPKSICGH